MSSGKEEVGRRRAQLESIETKCIRKKAFPSLAELFPSLDDSEPVSSTFFKPDQFEALVNTNPEEFWRSLLRTSELVHNSHDDENNEDESAESEDPIVGQESDSDED